MVASVGTNTMCEVFKYFQILSNTQPGASAMVHILAGVSGQTTAVYYITNHTITLKQHQTLHTKHSVYGLT